MKKVIAINGSPRKNDTAHNPANTHKLLMYVLDGAKSAGAEIEIFNLYDIQNWSGCISCFKCKGKQRLETCSLHDSLRLVLDKITKCDVLVLGSPIYLGNVSGSMRSFFERLVYPYLSYTKEQTKTDLRTFFIYTMNRSYEAALESNYQAVFEKNKEFLERVFGRSDYLVFPETYQWDYNRFPCERFDGKQREIRRRNIFPQECEKAYILGQNLVKET